MIRAVVELHDRNMSEEETTTGRSKRIYRWCVDRKILQWRLVFYFKERQKLVSTGQGNNEDRHVGATRKEYRCYK